MRPTGLEGRNWTEERKEILRARAGISGIPVQAV